MKIKALTLFIVFFAGLFVKADVASVDTLLKAVAQRPADSYHFDGAFNQGLLDSSMTFYSNSTTPEVQIFIDQAFLDLFPTSIGSLTCGIIPSNPLLIQNQLGLSLKAAKQVVEICHAKNIAMADSSVPNLRISKHYLFVFNIPQNFPIQSWTTMNNDTFIFFEGPLTKEDIYARIFHEFYMTYDNMLLFSRQTLPLYFAPTGPFSTSGASLSRNSPADKIIGLIPMPALKFALATLRAIQFESACIEDVFGASGSAAMANQDVLLLLKKKDFANALRLTLKALIPLQDYLLPAEYLIIPARDRMTMIPNYYIDENGGEQLVQMLNTSKLKIHFPNHGKKVSFIEWLMTPNIGISSSFYTRGPRPRIGIGWRGNQPKDKLNGDRIDMLQGLLDSKNKVRMGLPKTNVESDFMTIISQKAQLFQGTQDAQKTSQTSGN
jgi:hypothetical protein